MSEVLMLRDAGGVWVEDNRIALVRVSEKAEG